MEVTGTIKFIGETESIGAKGFQKRLLVLTTEEEYPQHLSIEFVQDKVGLLNTYNLGQSVSVGINLRGREWTNPQGETKYFNSIQGWKIGNIISDNEQGQINEMDVKTDEEEDLPF